MKAVDSCFAEPVLQKSTSPNCPLLGQEVELVTPLGQEVELVIEARGSGGSERARGKS